MLIFTCCWGLNSISAKCLLLNTDHEEWDRVFATLIFKNVKYISCTRPLEANYFLASHKSNCLSNESFNWIIDHFININTVSLSIKSVLLLPCFELTLSKSMDCHLGMEWFPLHRMEFYDLTVYKDLLVWEWGLLCVEKFNWVLCCFLFFVLIHHCKVVSLRMEV